MENNDYNLENIEKYLHGIPVYFYEKTQSTNDIACYVSGDFGVVVAESQSAGRGRKGRSFISSLGGVYLSYWFEPSAFLKEKLGHHQTTQIVLLAGIAIIRALKEYNINAQLKWPNDILFNGKKLAGILCETKTNGNNIDRVIIGIGLNANNKISLPQTTTLNQILQKNIDLSRLVALIVSNVHQILGEYSKNGFDSLRQEYINFSCILGKKVLISTLKEDYTATALDIDNLGFLLIKRDGRQSIEKLLVGEISLRLA